MLGLITDSWTDFKSPANCLPPCYKTNCLKRKDCIFINLEVEAITVSLCAYFTVYEATSLLLLCFLFWRPDFMFQLSFISVWYWRKILSWGYTGAELLPSVQIEATVWLISQLQARVPNPLFYSRKWDEIILWLNNLFNKYSSNMDEEFNFFC